MATEKKPETTIAPAKTEPPKAAEPAPVPFDPVKTFQSKAAIAAIKEVLPKYMTPSRFLSMAIAASKVLAQDPNIIPGSVMVAVYEAAKLGLELGGTTGHAYLIPFKNNDTGKTVVQLITGYKGLIYLCKKNGNVADMKPIIVYEKDKFEQWNDDTGSHFRHEPTVGERGKPVAVYCMTTTKDGQVFFHITHIEKIRQVEEGAKRRGGAVWKSDRDSMILKTAVRQAAKYQTITPEVDGLIGREERMEIGQIESAIPQGLEGIVDASYTEEIEKINAADQASSKPETKAPKDKVPVTKPAERQPGEDD
jgi:recombination protein RecT